MVFVRRATQAHRPSASLGAAIVLSLCAARCTIDVALVRERGDSTTAHDVAPPRDEDAAVDAYDAREFDSPEEDASAPADSGDASADGPTSDAAVGAWQRVLAPTLSDLRSVWGFGSRDVWIVGDRSTILRWTGTVWAPVANPASNTSFRSVWGIAPNDVWAAGYDTFGTLVIVHYDGRSWARVPAPPVRYLPRAVFGTSSADVWIVGGRVEYSDDILFRWNGTRWNSVRTGGTRTRYLDIGGTSPNDLWIVSLDDTMLRWNGLSFIAPAATLPVAVVTFEIGLWASGVDEFWVTGDAGTIHRYERGSWSSMNAGTRNLLRSIWGLDRSNLWAVGTRGTIARSNGTSWTAVEDVTPRTLYGVWAASPDDAWVVGEGGTILHSIP